MDLFSGIGGFALALSSVSKTVAFCEIDPFASRVLAKRMPGIPISNDVKLIQKKDFASLKPELITAGFPCQDISCLMKPDKAQGIYGEKSRLFFEIPRIVKSCKSILHVFLENSPCIYDRGMDIVLDELRSVGLNQIAYGVFSAGEVGAPHSRKRWFCIASKAPQKLKLMSRVDFERALDNEWIGQDFDSKKRLLDRRNNYVYSDSRKRLSMLGNAVVPQCVAYAYQTLASSLTLPPSILTESVAGIHGKIALYQSVSVIRHVGGAVSIYTVPKSLMDAASPYLRAALIKPRQHVQDMRLVFRDEDGRAVVKKRWRTPTSGENSWNQARRMTDRALWNLGNMIFYEESTRCPDSPGNIAYMSNHCMINPRFVEWMMGFPQNWTDWTVDRVYSETDFNSAARGKERYENKRSRGKSSHAARDNPL